MFLFNLPLFLSLAQARTSDKNQTSALVSNILVHFVNK